MQRLSKKGRVCVRAKTPGKRREGYSYVPTCPEGYRVERLGVLHDGAKKRVAWWPGGRRYRTRSGLGDGWRKTCLAIVRPGTDVGRRWDAPASRKFRKDHPITQVGGVDLRTRHYRSFRSGVSECRRKCKGSAICVAYNYSFRAKRCYLYDNETGKHHKVYRRSGYLAGFRTNKQGEPMRQLSFTSFKAASTRCYAGRALKTMLVSKRTEAACQLACLDEGDCTFYQLDRVGRSSRYRCKLYAKKPAQTSRRRCGKSGEHRHRKPPGERGGKG